MPSLQATTIIQQMLSGTAARQSWPCVLAMTAPRSFRNFKTLVLRFPDSDSLLRAEINLDLAAMAKMRDDTLMAGLTWRQLNVDRLAAGRN